jgi:hypothetical protein
MTVPGEFCWPSMGSFAWPSSQMVERGAHHTKALCVVAANLAERAWATLGRGERYVLRDLDGTTITVAQGKAIVAEKLKVPEEVRRRRRTAKRAGKAPQVLEAHAVKSRHAGRTAEATFPAHPASAAQRSPSSATAKLQPARALTKAST